MTAAFVTNPDRLAAIIKNVSHLSGACSDAQGMAVDSMLFIDVLCM